MKKLFLNHFNLCKKSGDDTTNIETLYFQTVFDICISDKFLDKDQTFQIQNIKFAFNKQTKFRNI
jgi:hypothetical protein